MKNNNEKVANFLVTVTYPDDTDLATDIKNEIDIQTELGNLMIEFIKNHKISRFNIAPDDVISPKITETE